MSCRTGLKERKDKKGERKEGNREIESKSDIHIFLFDNELCQQEARLWEKVSVLETQTQHPST